MSKIITRLPVNIWLPHCCWRCGTQTNYATYTMTIEIIQNKQWWWTTTDVIFHCLVATLLLAMWHLNGGSRVVSDHINDKGEWWHALLFAVWLGIHIRKSHKGREYLPGLERWDIIIHHLVAMLLLATWHLNGGSNGGIGVVSDQRNDKGKQQYVLLFTIWLAIHIRKSHKGREYWLTRAWTMTNDETSLFVVWFPHCCWRCSTSNHCCGWAWSGVWWLVVIVLWLWWLCCGVNRCHGVMLWLCCGHG